jgi:hypothetical protein
LKAKIISIFRQIVTTSKATMKITASGASRKDRKQFPVDLDVPDHFKSEKTRRERKIEKAKKLAGLLK